jgi:hypothetical protein
VSFLVSLLLPVIATVIYFYRYPDRAAAGQVPARLTTATAVAKGALTGASALLFLGALGVIILIQRGRVLTPPEVETPAAVFWGIQFLLAAGIGAVVGALSAVALLPWVRERLGQTVPAGPDE